MTEQDATIALLQRAPSSVESLPADEAAGKKDKKKKKDQDKKDLSRGIETMYRVTFQNHIQLSQLADGKAGILISVNGVIISIVIALIAPRIQEVGPEMLPAMVLLMGGLISLAFAIFASRPRIKKTQVTLGDIREDRSSILFFGHFKDLAPADFEAAMHELMENRRLLYNNLIREIYSMGQVLTKKYYYLNTAYMTFLVTISSAVSLLIVLVLLDSYLPLWGN